MVDNHYYGVQEAHNNDSVALIKEIICPNYPPDENYQCWRYYLPPPVDAWLCNTEDQYPAPMPGGCP